MSQTIEEAPTRQERLNTLIANLAEYIELDSSIINQYGQELCAIYSEKDFRHSYAQISIEIEKLAPDQRDVLCANLESFKESVSPLLEKGDFPAETKREVLQKISKLCDHVELESIRLSRIDKVEYIGSEASKALTDADGKLKETEEKANALSDRVSDYHSQSISILGIFSGLVITFSCVTQFSVSSLSNFSSSNAYKVTYFLCLSFFFLFNIIFMLMYSISKLSGKSIAVDCTKKNCANCKHCKVIFARLKKKYPFVFWFDLIGLIFVILSFILAKS